MPLLMLFLDGVGLGLSEAATNPLVAAEMSFLRSCFGGEPLTAATVGAGKTAPYFICRPTDATLGVPGLPQSATGQTVIFTGINAARVSGRHISGFPTKNLRRIIEVHSIFKRLNQAGRRAVFANVFTKEYFETVNQGRWWHSVTTTAALAGNCELLMISDLQAGTAVYQDITNEQLQAKGYQITRLGPEEAAANLLRQALHNDFTLFEYFQTDRCGHGQNGELAWELLHRLDRFIGYLAGQTVPNGLDVLIVSDHGNIEDLSVKTHTLNLVPTIAMGTRAEEFGEIKTLLDIYPAVLRYFGIKNNE